MVSRLASASSFSLFQPTLAPLGSPSQRCIINNRPYLSKEIGCFRPGVNSLVGTRAVHTESTDSTPNSFFSRAFTAWKTFNTGFTKRVFSLLDFNNSKKELEEMLKEYRKMRRRFRNEPEEEKDKEEESSKKDDEDKGNGGDGKEPKKNEDDNDKDDKDKGKKDDKDKEKDKEDDTTKNSDNKKSKDKDSTKDDRDRDEKPKERKKSRKPFGDVDEDDLQMFGFLAIGGLSFAALYWLFWNGTSIGAPEVDLETFIQHYLAEGKVTSMEVYNKHNVTAYLNTGGRVAFSIGSVEAFERKLEDALEFYHVPLEARPGVRYHESGKLPSLVFNLMVIAAAFMIMGRMLRKTMSGATRMRATKAKVTQGTKSDVKFADVAGLDEAKLEIMEFVDFLKNPQKYSKLGAKIPKGALLAGSPGTGKTMLAKAAAGEAGVPFFSISGSDFVEMFVGVGPARVRDLFSKARESAPSMIWIDEIDAVAKPRGRGRNSNDERENTVNQLLVEMDGFENNAGVVVFAGTNRPDSLDKALLRPGRFDRTIYLPAPDIKGRRDIFKVHLKKLKLKDSVDTVAERMAAVTPGFVGADIANICNEGALLATRRNKQAIEIQDFEDAIEKVVVGLEKKSRVMSKEEKNITAHHEAGHAIVSWFNEHGHPLVKVSIIPRGPSALGYAMYNPRETHLHTKEELFAEMCAALGGRVAEKIIFGHLSSGAADDLEKVTKLAYKWVSEYGMSQRVGPLSFDDQGDSLDKPFSESTSTLIDEEVRTLVQSAFDATDKLLNEKRDILESVAKRLLDKEVLTRDDMIELAGRRPWGDDDLSFEKIVKDGENPHKPETITPADNPPPTIPPLSPSPA